MEDMSKSSGSDIEINQDSLQDQSSSDSSPTSARGRLQKISSPLFNPKSMDIALPTIKEEMIQTTERRVSEEELEDLEKQDTISIKSEAAEPVRERVDHDSINMRRALLGACSVTCLVLSENVEEAVIRTVVVLAVILSEIASLYIKIRYLELLQASIVLIALDYRPIQTILILMTTRFSQEMGTYQMVILGLIVTCNWARNFVTEYKAEELFTCIIEVLAVCIQLRLKESKKGLL